METRIPDQTKGKGSNHDQKNVPASAGRPGSSDEHPPFRYEYERLGMGLGLFYEGNVVNEFHLTLIFY